MGAATDWEPVIDALGDRFFCIAADLPGHGGSLRLPDDAYTIEGAGRAVIGLLDGLGVERAVLAGYSMGGRLALYVALRHPGRCAGLVLESASPGLEDAAARADRRRADEEKAARLESGDFEEFLRDWYRQPLFAPLARDEDLLRRTVEARRANVPRELARSLRGMGTGSQPSLWEELAGLRLPALALAGELDEKYVALARRMAGLSRNLRADIVPEAGHNVHAESPREHLEALERFMRADEPGLDSVTPGL